MVLAVLASWLIAGGFVVQGPREGGRDAIDHLERAPRWGLSANSLVGSGERGLGGGIEYAIDASVCELRFIDGATCPQIRNGVRKALQAWGEGHPVLTFVDVSDQVVPSLPLGPGRQGAEIDVFGVGAARFAPFANSQLTGYTIFYERPQSALVLTNGQIAKGAGRIESADIRLSAERCFYIDPEKGRPACVHFPSVVLHEAGHALGLGHPEEDAALNLDRDGEPGNALTIDCRNPAAGLLVSPRYDAASVLIGQDVQGPGRWLRGLSWDDVAGRDALYPHCAIEARARFGGRWGAYARAGNGREGLALSEADAGAADGQALARCAADGGQDCRVIARFDDCFALAEAPGDVIGSARAGRSDHARVDAVLSCHERGGEGCRVRLQACAFGPT